MRRLIVILIVAGLVAGGIAWLAGNDGTVTLTLAGYEFRSNASVAAILIALLAIVAVFFVRAATILIGGPAKFRAWLTQKRARGFYQSLSRGLVAAAAGDAEEATSFARRSEKQLHNQPLGLLLKAQAAGLSGDDATEESAYREMLKYPDTEFLGLRGLFELAARRRDVDQALAFAARAYTLKPKAWAMNALFDLRVSRREWREALTLVTQATRTKMLAPEAARRRRAVLLAAEAVEAEHAGDAAALAHALEALTLAPGLTAAALIAARHLKERGELRKAQDIVEAAWAEAPHRDLARAYAELWPDYDKEARAQKLIDLAKLNPSHRESRLLMAEQKAALHQWREAYEALAPYAEDYSSARVCILMAEIAQGEDDVLSAQLWRSRAARAGHVMNWRCGRCNGIAPDWGPVCGHCGAFDSLAWAAPDLPATHQGVQTYGSIADAPARGATDLTKAAPGFVRPPDDPGPGAQTGIFEPGESEIRTPEPSHDRNGR